MADTLERPRPTGAQWRDLRDWLGLAHDIGELRVVRGADSESDIGHITEMLDHTEGSPCVLFDAIPGFQDGYRLAVNTQGTLKRQAITLGLDPASVTHDRLLGRWREILRGFEPIPPRTVPEGPILQNVQRTTYHN